LQVLYTVKTLNARGFRRNDRIAVIFPAGPEIAVITVSVMAGFTCVTLNPQNRQTQYETDFSRLRIKAVIILKDSETAARAVAESQKIPLFELIPVTGIAGSFTLEPACTVNATEPEFATPEDLSHLLFTAGTTARSKVVTVTQRQSFFSRLSQIKPFNITRADRCLHILPYYHGLGIGLPLLGILLAGGTVICTRDFIPSDFFHLLKTFRPTYYVAVPALHQGICHELKKRAPDELQNNSLRLIMSSSSSMPEQVSRDLETLLGAPVIEILASSEAGTIAINYPPKKGSVGIPFIDHFKIQNESGDTLMPYEPGEIVVRGETVFWGYEDDPEENRAAFFNGWFRTGDLGYLDDEGYLFITGRIKELINKGGRKIAPVEIDTVLVSHPGVRDAMTFAVFDPVLGEDIAAIVVRADEKLTETNLREYLLDHLVPFKVPRKIRFVDEIPRNSAGKPLRYEGTKRYS
jgi:acyl-CoA synthetase (AMP-forming)/AMP-acid ligase II